MCERADYVVVTDERQKFSTVEREPLLGLDLLR
jgi:hypothetical protein